MVRPSTHSDRGPGADGTELKVDKKVSLPGIDFEMLTEYSRTQVPRRTHSSGVATYPQWSWDHLSKVFLISEYSRFRRSGAVLPSLVEHLWSLSLQKSKLLQNLKRWESQHYIQMLGFWSILDFGCLDEECPTYILPLWECVFFKRWHLFVT